MRGQLKTIILSILEKESLTGSDIIKKIEKELNWKPSYGSIYPMLKTMVEEKLVAYKEEKGKKIYSITKNGERELSKLKDDKKELANALRKVHRLMENVYGMNPESDKELKEIEQGNLPLVEIDKESKDMRKEIIRIMKKKDFNENKNKLKKILNQTTKELKKIK